MPGQQSLQCIAKVLKQVPPIRDLDGVARAGARTLREVSRAVTTHDRHRGMGLQPGSEGRSVGIRYDIDGPMALQIHDQRAIRAPFAHRPIIHPDDCLLYTSDAADE